MMHIEQAADLLSRLTKRTTEATRRAARQRQILRRVEPLDNLAAFPKSPRRARCASKGTLPPIANLFEGLLCQRVRSRVTASRRQAAERVTSEIVQTIDRSNRHCGSSQ
jgi:hypothetical protein